MGNSYFTLIDQSSLTGRYLAELPTTGPWSPQLQHGGPPSALAVSAAERAVHVETGRDDLVALRVAADFVGPVPVAEIETRARLVRIARSAALAEVVVSAAGRDCLVTRVWFVRATDTPDLAAPALDLQPPAAAAGLDVEFPYGRSIDWRFVSGTMRRPGPSAVWAHPQLGLVEGYDYSGLARTVLVADSASGVSAELDWATWSFVNVDLDVHLARPLVGEWVLLDASTQLGTAGSALARSTLSDVHGPVGAGLQTLVIAPLAPANPTR